eukprot:6481-Pleurochrysis_carterae.AAC.3
MTAKRSLSDRAREGVAPERKKGIKAIKVISVETQDHSPRDAIDGEEAKSTEDEIRVRSSDERDRMQPSRPTSPRAAEGERAFRLRRLALGFAVRAGAARLLLAAAFLGAGLGFCFGGGCQTGWRGRRHERSS